MNQLAVNAPVPPVRTNRQKLWAWARRIHPMHFSFENACDEFHWLEADSVRRALGDLRKAGKVTFVEGSKRLYVCVVDAAPPGVQGRPRLTFLPVEG